MASTIQLKTGTGSAVPANLTQGELAINVDNGLVYYGSGSTNTTKKLETFTNITASSNISASGHVEANRMYPQGISKPFISTAKGQIISSTGLAGTNITASGNISASGNVYAKDYFNDGTNINTLYSPIEGSEQIITVGTISEGTWNGAPIASAYLDADTAHLTTDQTFSGKKTFSAAITASGNISASGDISASNIHLPGQGKITFQTDQFITGQNNSITIDGDNTIKLKADNYVEFQNNSGDAKVVIDPNNGHISASGTIRGREIHIVNTAFKDDLNTDEIFVPWNSTTENAAVGNLNVPIIMPCAGKVLKVLYRSNADNSGVTATWRLRTVANNETITLGHAGIVGTTTCTGPNTGSVATADFTGVSSNEFNAEDLIYISIQNGGDVGGEIIYWVTLVLELHYDTLGY